MKVLKIIALSLVILVLGGCAISMVNLGNTVNKGDEKAQALTDVRDSIYLGMSMSEVRSLAGKPEDSSHDEMRSYDGTTDTTDYWYYGVLSSDGWQLVFENDKLRSINET